MSQVGSPFIFATEGKADFSIGEVRLGTDAEVVLPCA
jgi:beta-glucosidase